MTDPAPVSLADVCDFLEVEGTPTTPVTIDMGSAADQIVIMTPMVGMAADPAEPDSLTVMPVPAEPGELQSTREILDLLRPYLSRPDLAASPLVIAPLGAPSRVVVAPMRLEGGIAFLATAPQA